MDPREKECRRRWWFAARGKPCLPSAPGANPDLRRFDRYAVSGQDDLYDEVTRMLPAGDLLRAAVEALSASGPGMTFGAALDEACRRLRLERSEVPEEVERAVLLSSFKVFAGGRLPGAPDA